MASLRHPHPFLPLSLRPPSTTMFSTAATSLLLKRDGEDITGNATAIAEACGGVEELDRMGLRVRLSSSASVLLSSALQFLLTDHSDRFISS